MFNGDVLHGVIPGREHVSGGNTDERRVTFMVAFWEDIKATVGLIAHNQPSCEGSHTGAQHRNIVQPWTLRPSYPLELRVSYCCCASSFSVVNHDTRHSPLASFEVPPSHLSFNTWTTL